RQTRLAMDKTGETRRATAVLDAVARDLERVVLVRKPAGVEDPLSHPWIFYAEAEPGAEGADRLRFVTRGHPPRLSAKPDSDLEVVFYSVHEGEAGTRDRPVLELWRKASPRLPESAGRELAHSRTGGALLRAGGPADFGVRFSGGGGQGTSGWASSSLVRADQPPAAAEIRVALAHPDDPDAAPTLFTRRVVLPLRPLDFDELLDPQSAVSGGTKKHGDDDQASNDSCQQGPCGAMAVCQAVDCSANENGSTATLLAVITGQPYCQWRTRLPSSLRSRVRNPACR